ncbi:hypothetical protein, partial [Francisella sp. SYW-2]|uniref:hypothetical protein n=1 Tax=Francisella sp. SYW-2 TaxID=2610886 RepID=UPI001CD0DF22
QLLKMNDVVTGTLGLGISTLQLIQSVRSLAESMNQNDEHIIRADMANFINAGATTVSSAKAIADTLKDQAREKLKDMAIESRAKKNLAKGGIDALDTIAQKGGTRTALAEAGESRLLYMIERLGIRAAGFLSIPYLGEILLVIDIATTLWAAWEEAHKDNIYQQWVKLSNLYP